MYFMILRDRRIRPNYKQLQWQPEGDQGKKKEVGNSTLDKLSRTEDSQLYVSRDNISVRPNVKLGHSLVIHISICL